MYAVLSKLNSVSRNIVTVEDPVEYRLSGINQVASDNEHGLGFANALKYIMRQDPDVIMVGEIRDHETASTAVQAALTGHLLISTLHANDAIGADRPARTTWASTASRSAVRCWARSPSGCCGRFAPSARSRSSRTSRCSRRWRRIGKVPTDAVFYRGRGCKKCLGTGYSGRIPIYEIMVVTPAMAEGDRKRPAGDEASANRPVRRHGRAGRRRHGAGARRPHDVGRSVLQTVGLMSAVVGRHDEALTTTIRRTIHATHEETISGQRGGDRRRPAAIDCVARVGCGAELVAAIRPVAAARPARSSRTATWSFILRNLATLTESGVSLPKALGTLAEEKALEKHRDMLHAIRRHLENGESFSSALAQFGSTFDTVMVNQIKVGEHSGTLAETLDDHRPPLRGRAPAAVRNHPQAGLPDDLLVVMGTRGHHVLADVRHPVFKETYDKAHVPLPFITQLLIAVGQCGEELRLDRAGARGDGRRWSCGSSARRPDVRLQNGRGDPANVRSSATGCATSPCCN